MHTAKEILVTAIHGVEMLSDTYKTKADLFDGIARQSGISASAVSKIYYRTRSPGVEVLDRLALGVQQLVERRL